MRKNRIRKLRLNRESLRILDALSLGTAQGGVWIETVRGCPIGTGNCISVNVGCTQKLDTCPEQTIGIG
ncbi:MAG TPA: hypothetical protein VF789_14970 [Thermoanaerobaculia bacterium]